MWSVCGGVNSEKTGNADRLINILLIYLIKSNTSNLEPSLHFIESELVTVHHVELEPPTPSNR